MVILFIIILNKLWQSAYGGDPVKAQIYNSFLPVSRALPAPKYLDLKVSVVKTFVFLAVASCLVWFFNLTTVSVIVLIIGITPVFLQYWAKHTEFLTLFQNNENIKSILSKASTHCIAPVLYAVYSFIVFFMVYATRP